MIKDKRVNNTCQKRKGNKTKWIKYCKWALLPQVFMTLIKVNNGP